MPVCARLCLPTTAPTASAPTANIPIQTSKDWFYPDFICQIHDGRVMAVDYKGEHLWADAEEKRAVVAVWESRSNGRCLFVMPTEGDYFAITNRL